ncbi:MAG: endolytic transglycosylase MltG [Microbacteriaceae bacterium]
MPESSSDDPFADLFGKLPDPRTRALSTTDADADAERAPADGAPRPAQAAPATPPADAPLSRRAAREAASRGGTAPETAPSPTPPSPAAPEPPAAAPARPAAQPQAEPRPAPNPVPADPQPVAASRADDAVAASGARPVIPVAPAEDPVAVDAGPAYARTGAVHDSAPEPRRRATAGSPGLEDLFAGTASADDLGSTPPPPDKRKRRIGGWIALGVVLVILGGITAGGFYVWNTYEDKIREFMGWEEPKDFEAGLANGEAFLTIVSGDTGASISPKLFEAGVTKTDDAFYDYLVEENLNPPFVPGVFALQKQMTSEAALEAILDPANKRENTAQLREGLTLEQSLPLLAEGTGLPIEDFQAAVADPTVYGVPLDAAVAEAGGQPLEGWLFPATYTFDPGVTAQDVIQRLVNRTIESLDAAGVPVEDRQRILTIASIIQREARSEADMQKVSTVIVNRMNPDNQQTFGLLQMDSTAQYGYGEMHDGTVSSSGEALDDDNPWNTYVRTGLPVGPIANPGDTAIASAMNPAEGDWMYFVTVNLDTGETVFTSNVDDHNRAVEQWRSWCRDNPDSGC